MRARCIGFPKSLFSLNAFAAKFEPEFLFSRFRYVGYNCRVVPDRIPTWIAARSSILAALEQAITVGHLTISDLDGIHYFGRREKGCNDVYVQVISSTFWIRVMLAGDLGCEN
jgi:hypothetical protein